jgi:hypothetical protein
VPKHDVAIGTSGMSTLRTVGIMGTAPAGNLAGRQWSMQIPIDIGNRGG